MEQDDWTAVIAYQYRQENERLRAAIHQAHGALTKASLTASERVYDATVVLSRVLTLPLTASEADSMGLGFYGDSV